MRSYAHCRLSRARNDNTQRVLVGDLCARLAREHDVPMPFLVQPPLEPRASKRRADVHPTLSHDLAEYFVAGMKHVCLPVVHIRHPLGVVLDAQ